MEDPEEERWAQANKAGLWLVVFPLTIGVVLVMVGVLLNIVFGIK